MVTCDLFDEMFRVIQDDTNGPNDTTSTSSKLPIIPLLESSTVAFIVLPMIYRTAPTDLETEDLDILMRATRLAHRLGLSSMLVGWIAHYLERQ